MCKLKPRNRGPLVASWSPGMGSDDAQRPRHGIPLGEKWKTHDGPVSALLRRREEILERLMISNFILSRFL